MPTNAKQDIMIQEIVDTLIWPLTPPPTATTRLQSEESNKKAQETSNKNKRVSSTLLKRTTLLWVHLVVALAMPLYYWIFCRIAYSLGC